MVFRFLSMASFFHVIVVFIQIWANFLVAITGSIGTVMVGVTTTLIIPWGLRLPKEKRHPFKKRPCVNNGLNQLTMSRQG